MKRRTGQQAQALFRSTESDAPRIQQSETSETPETSERNKGGRPRKERPEVRKYTVSLTPEQWGFLSRYAGEMLSKGTETDRSDILRRLVDRLRAGDIHI